MDAHAGKEEEADAPKGGGRQDVMQFVGVGVDDFRAEENLKIPEHVPHDKQDQYQTRQRHENFATNGGFEKATERDHNV